MEIQQRNMPIIMSRDNWDGLPHFDLPAGYTFRWYQPGDEETWVRVQAAAERLIPITLELYRESFGADPAPLMARQFFILDEKGEPIATSTAWFDDVHHDPQCGRVHWVAIVPEKQGLGLAKPLLSMTCERLRELGNERAYLATSSMRIPALNLYRLFGFQPVLNSDTDRATWEEVAPLLRH
jgi:GNAT superfamily N-acetyltransferase